MLCYSKPMNWLDSHSVFSLVVIFSGLCWLAIDFYLSKDEDLGFWQKLFALTVLGPVLSGGGLALFGLLMLIVGIFR